MPERDASGLASQQPDVALVPVRVVQGYMVAQVLKSKLASEGIPVVLRYESVGHVLGITVDGLGRVEVLVPASLQARARAALDEAEPLADLPADQA